MPRLRKDGTPYGARLNWTLILAQAAIIAGQYTTAVTLRQLHYRLVAAPSAATRTPRPLQGAVRADQRGPAPRHLPGPVRHAPAASPARSRSTARPTPSSWVKQITGATAPRTRRTRSGCCSRRPRWLPRSRRGHGTTASPPPRCAATRRSRWSGRSWTAMARTGAPSSCSTSVTSTPRARTSSATSWTRRRGWGSPSSTGNGSACARPGHLASSLVPNPGKATSSRAAGFVRKYGRLFQIEVEAIDPAILETLVTDAITDTSWFDQAFLDDSIDQEADDIERAYRCR